MRPRMVDERLELVSAIANNSHLENFGVKRGRLNHVMLKACMTAELARVVGTMQKSSTTAFRC